MKISNDMSKLATAGEDSIRIHSAGNLKVVDSIIPIPDDTAGGFRNISWSDNGALIAALTNAGTLYVYLTELTVLGQSCGNRLGYLSLELQNDVSWIPLENLKNLKKKIIVEKKNFWLLFYSAYINTKCFKNAIFFKSKNFLSFSNSIFRLLSEVTIFESGGNKSRRINLSMEPNFVGMGPYHFAAGMNNKAVFYLLDEDEPTTIVQDSFLIG